jgi:D-alanine-D-alanine ligase-like ATP-grasp enzyme
MADLLAVASYVERLGERPLATLREQLGFLNSVGVSAELMVDPSAITLEMKIRRDRAGIVYLTPLRRPDEAEVDTRLLNHHMLLTRLLQQLGQPFIGQDFASQLSINDKMLCAHVSGIHPPGWLFTRNDHISGLEASLIEQLPEDAFPVLAKPNTLWASMGIGTDSIARSRDVVGIVLHRIFDRFPHLCEVRLETFFEDAREATVAVVGNDDRLIVAVTELLSDDIGRRINDEHEKMAALDTKRIRYRPWPKDQYRTELERLGCGLFEKFRFMDVARFDILIADRAYVIDVNDMPYLGNAFCCDLADRFGLKPEQLLAVVMAAACQRKPINLPTSFWMSLPPAFRFAV